MQITWLGYPNTTGLPAIDFRITDARCDPPGQTEQFHVERLARLDGCFICYVPPEQSPDVAPPPSLSTGQITFGSFNNLAKVTPRLLALWAGILQRVPDSRLLLKAKAMRNASAQSRLRQIFSERGISPERLVTLPQDPSYEKHLGSYGQIDIALDTWPYCGTTTTCEALWMGVPVLTLAGPTHVSRVGASLLHAVGLDELVANSADEYLARAAELAGDRERLTTLRRDLRQRMEASVLCDARGFAGRMQELFQRLWRERSAS